MEKEKIRFLMVKERHKKTFQQACITGKVDRQISSFCEFIAQTKNYFTTSTCSGRIVLLQVNKEETKQGSAFVTKWHGTVLPKTIWEKLLEKTTGEIWFKQEPFIIHIGCIDYAGAKKLLAIAKECGIKRAGINAATEGKLILELIGTQNIAFPIKIENKILMKKENLNYIIGRANKKLEKNYMQLKKFETQCQEKLE